MHSIPMILRRSSCWHWIENAKGTIGSRFVWWVLLSKIRLRSRQRDASACRARRCGDAQGRSKEKNVVQLVVQLFRLAPSFLIEDAFNVLVLSQGRKESVRAIQLQVDDGIDNDKDDASISVDDVRVWWYTLQALVSRQIEKWIKNPFINHAISFHP